MFRVNAFLVKFYDSYAAECLIVKNDEDEAVNLQLKRENGDVPTGRTLQRVYLRNSW